MSPNHQVDSWFAGKPAEAALLRVRAVLLHADPRIGEHLKYGTVVFTGSGVDCVSFVQHDKKNVSLMFHRGARIPGKFPHLEGNGPTARFMRFADVAEVDARAAELARIVVAWCDLMAPTQSRSSVKKSR